MEAGEYGLTRGTCFVASRLELVAVAGLLWVSWCVWVGRIFSFFFFKQKTAYEIASCLVGSEMCIRDRPILVRFHRSRVCGNRPRITLAISKNDECYKIHTQTTHTDRRTDKLNNGTLYAPRYEEAFLLIDKKRPH